MRPNRLLRLTPIIKYKVLYGLSAVDSVRKSNTTFDYNNVIYYTLGGGGYRGGGGGGLQ